MGGGKVRVGAGKVSVGEGKVSVGEGKVSEGCLNRNEVPSNGTLKNTSSPSTNWDSAYFGFGRTWIFS